MQVLILKKSSKSLDIGTILGIVFYYVQTRLGSLDLDPERLFHILDKLHRSVFPYWMTDNRLSFNYASFHFITQIVLP